MSPAGRAGAAALLLLLAVCALAPAAAAQSSGGFAPPEAAPIPRPAELPRNPHVDAPPLVERAELRIAAIDRYAAEIEQSLDRRALTEEQIERARTASAEQAAEARRMASALRDEAAPVVAQLDALGAPPDSGTEAADIAERRAALSERLAVIEGRAREADRAAARADALESRLADRQRRRQADRLLTARPGLLDLDAWRRAGAQLAALGGRVAADLAAAAPLMDPSSPPLATAIALAALLALWLALGGPVGAVAGRIQAALRSEAEDPPLGRGRVATLSAELALIRVTPAALLSGALVALASAEGLQGAARARASASATAVVAVFGVYALSRIVFAPALPNRRLIPIDDAAAWRNVRRAAALAAVVFGVWALRRVAQTAGVGPDLTAVVDALEAIVAAPLFFGLVAALLTEPAPARHEEAAAEFGAADDDGEPPETEEEDDDGGAPGLFRALLRGLALLVAMAAPVAAVFGFPELARFLIEKAAATVVALAAAWLAYVTIMRISAEERGGEAGPLAPLLAGGLLALMLTPGLALLWGASVADLRAAARGLLDGFELGGARFSPVDLIVAVAVFLIGLAVTRLIQRGLRRGVLKRTRLDSGVQSSIGAGVGYAGVLISALIAISATGLDLSSLALVAGALSVGVGFGLQNVVSNFVAGLILLIERPIKSGDWIRVGAAEGYVRKISVRSTEIETFDKSSVIVPNSELIANQVTNLTHRNLAGRAKVRLRLPFDTDADLVIRLMRETAREHPSVLRHPQPAAYCLGVGDSGLEFELWAYARDVNWVFALRSDLTLALLRKLRAEGLTPAYPQQDVHLRSLPAGEEPGSAALAPPAPSAEGAASRG